MARVIADVSLDIDRPVREVFAFVANPANMPLWVSNVTEAEYEDGAKPGQGAKYRVKYEYGGKVNDITMQTTTYARYSRYAFKTIAGPYPISGVCDLAPTGGGTRYTYTQEATSDSPVTALMFSTLGFLLKFPMRNLLRKDALKLKAAIEGSARVDL